MGKNVTAKPGRYRVASTPYQKEPQEAFTDPEVQTTVLYWASRLGKTEMMNNLEGSVIEQNPRNILVVYPTLDSAKKWSKQFFTPMVKSTPVLRGKIRDARSKDASNTILSKEFPGGNISAIGTNSPSGFRQVQAPVVVCDEIDAMENGPEGDPVTLAFKRAENYPDSIQIVASTATIKSTSRIEAWYQKSDQRKWFCPCPKCGTYQILKWSQLKWPAGHVHEEAYYECENNACIAHWNDEMRVSAILAGEWRATAPFKGIRGYWLNGLNTTFAPKKGYKSKMHQMAAEFHEAYTSGEAARITWKNTFLCEAHEEATERIDAEPLLERCEDYHPQALPNEIVVAALIVDVQGDRLEWETIGMGESDEDWGIEFGKIFGNPEKDEPWKDLLGVLAKTYKRRDGVEIKFACIGVDHRHKGKRVRKFLKKCGHPRAYAIYGASGNQSILVRGSMHKLYRINLFSVNTDSAKDTIFARLRLEDHGPGFMHFPKGNGYDSHYFDGLTAEEVRTSYKSGFAVRKYEKIRERNEPLDLRVYFLAAMDILKPNIKAIAAGLNANRPQPVVKDYILKDPEQPKPQPEKPKSLPRPNRSKGGWVGGWRR